MIVYCSGAIPEDGVGSNYLSRSRRSMSVTVCLLASCSCSRIRCAAEPERVVKANLLCINFSGDYYFSNENCSFDRASQHREHSPSFCRLLILQCANRRRDGISGPSLFASPVCRPCDVDGLLRPHQQLSYSVGLWLSEVSLCSGCLKSVMLMRREMRFSMSFMAVEKVENLRRLPDHASQKHSPLDRSRSISRTSFHISRREKKQRSIPIPNRLWLSDQQHLHITDHYLQIED